MCENGTVFNFGRIICLAIPSWYDYTRLFIFLYFVISDLDTDYLPYMMPEKTVDVSRSNQQFLLRAKKFHTDDMSLPSGWNFCARPSVLISRGKHPGGVAKCRLFSEAKKHGQYIHVSSMKTAFVSHYSEVPIVSRFQPRDG